MTNMRFINTFDFQLACKAADVDRCEERISKLEKKMLDSLEVRRKVKEKISEALQVEAEAEDQPTVDQIKLN